MKYKTALEFCYGRVRGKPKFDVPCEMPRGKIPSSLIIQLTHTIFITEQRGFIISSIG